MKELKKFFAILILMGLVQMPSLRHYWGKSGIFGVKLIKKTMNRDRFFLILKFLHFADNMGTFLPGDKLHKIKNFIDMFNEQCENLLEPRTELVIDETMVPFKGRLIRWLLFENYSIQWKT